MVINLQFFGGRGASSGISEKGNAYGTQYKILLEYENIKFVLISPKELRIPQYIRQEVLDKNNIEYCEVEKIEEVIESLDILYMTRIQKERFFNENEYLRLN